MLFGSLIFVFVFLPVSLVGYHWLRLSGWRHAAKGWMVCTSVFFYGWWDWRYIGLISISILANFWWSRLIERQEKYRSSLLAAGVFANLALLAYYKYANFFVKTIDGLIGIDLHVAHVVLPLAISFFTFQQITYLIESKRDGKAADSLTDYALFVLFFPHLIAGPITHHKEMLPQFSAAGAGRLPRTYILVGSAVFIMGLAKKVVIADSFAMLANPIFDVVRDGARLSAADAWLGALTYTLQIYFDFSGYSDMAIGLGLMFGILLPVNFASPYKSTSIIEFWRRWHISLSRFLRNYLYISLGGNRRGTVRRYLNLLATMALGGLWHGANWTFLIWGVLHGCYLIANHAWNGFGASRFVPQLVRPAAGWLITMLAVTVGWVLFRAENFGSATSILVSMGGGYGSGTVADFLVARTAGWLGVFAGFMIALTLPSVLEIVRYPQSTPGLPIEHEGLSPVSWKIHPLAAAVAVGCIAAFAFAKLPDPGTFLYFNF